MQIGSTSWYRSPRRAWRKTSISTQATQAAASHHLFSVPGDTHPEQQSRCVHWGELGGAGSCQATEGHHFTSYCIVWTEVNLKRTVIEVSFLFPLKSLETKAEHIGTSLKSRPLGRLRRENPSTQQFTASLGNRVRPPPPHLKNRNKYICLYMRIYRI